MHSIIYFLEICSLYFLRHETRISETDQVLTKTDSLPLPPSSRSAKIAGTLSSLLVFLLSVWQLEAWVSLLTLVSDA
jgi:hypothetical protein